MERDDLYVNDQYPIQSLHNEEAGVGIRKTIWKVTAILSIITFVEVLAGAQIKQGSTLWPFVKFSFIILTLVKAAYIIMKFMHLGEEKKILKYVIIIPYVVFILYLFFICFTEATAIHDIRSIWK